MRLTPIPYKFVFPNVEHKDFPFSYLQHRDNTNMIRDFMEMYWFLQSAKDPKLNQYIMEVHNATVQDGSNRGLAVIAFFSHKIASLIRWHLDDIHTWYMTAEEWNEKDIGIVGKIATNMARAVIESEDEGEVKILQFTGPNITLPGADL